MTAHEVLSLARRGGIAPGVKVLDLCCGVAGPGLLIAEELGCTYLGVDSHADSIADARRRAADRGLTVDFEVAQVPPIPWGPFDVVLLLETMLAFRDKRALLRAVSSALRVQGRFAFTLEEGRPLTAVERDMMPGSDTVWLTPLPDLVAELEQVGLRVRWHGELTGAHSEVAGALAAAYAGVGEDVIAGPDLAVVHDLVVAHRLWSLWLRSGRVRKLALVAERVNF